MYIREVERTFESELAVALEQVPGADTLHSALEASRARQRAWLKRTKSSKLSSWRPRKRPRQAAWRWLASIDHQLILAGLGGLKYWQQPKEDGDRGDPFFWPRVSVSMDLGSDGLAAANFAQRALSLCMEVVPDPSHLVHRGIQSDLRDCGLWVLIQTAMLVFNTPHGPWWDDLRFQQVREAMHTLLATVEPQRCPLFMDRAMIIPALSDHRTFKRVYI